MWLHLVKRVPLIILDVSSNPHRSRQLQLQTLKNGPCKGRLMISFSGLVPVKDHLKRALTERAWSLNRAAETDYPKMMIKK